MDKNAAVPPIPNPSTRRAGRGGEVGGAPPNMPNQVKPFQFQVRLRVLPRLPRDTGQRLRTANTGTGKHLGPVCREALEHDLQVLVRERQQGVGIFAGEEGDGKS